jgi:hypothetical protein
MMNEGGDEIAREREAREAEVIPAQEVNVGFASTTPQVWSAQASGTGSDEIGEFSVFTRARRWVRP